MRPIRAGGIRDGRFHRWVAIVKSADFRGTADGDLCFSCASISKRNRSVV